MGQNKSKCQVELRVPFFDLDAMQVVWHGNYLKYYDIARNELFERAGIDLYEYGLRTGYIFPIVKTMSKYIRPLRYQDRFVCLVEAVEVKRKIVLDFEIRLAVDGTLCARSRSIQVAVRREDFKLEILIPMDIQQALAGN